MSRIVWSPFKEPEYPISTETWNGGAGTISFNFLQQRPTEPVVEPPPAVNTDPWGITDGGFRAD